MSGWRSPLDRSVALFGEAGSGKTVLLTVFYGHQQSAQFKAGNHYSLLARDAGQGDRLLAAYYQLESDRVPSQNRFRADPYDFYLRVTGGPKCTGNLRWCDYPGEWWTDDFSGEVRQRRDELIRELVQSDVALFLVDGQKFCANGANYLRKLFASFHDELARQHETLLRGSKKLVHYPFIWIICLSKADLFPSYSVEDFRKDVLKHAEPEVRALREIIQSMVRQPDQVSLGQEYLLLSSSAFDPETNRVKDMKQTIGVDLITPICLLAPFHHARLRQQMAQGGRTTIRHLVDILRHLTIKWMKWLPIVGRFFQLLDEIARDGVAALQRWEENARARGDVTMAAICALQSRLMASDAQRVYFPKEQ